MPILGCWDCLWPFGQEMSFLGQKWQLLRPLGPAGDTFGGPKRPKQTPPDVFDNVQLCSTNVHTIWVCWRCLWPKNVLFGPKITILDASGAPGWHFLGALKAQTDPPGCVWQCSTMFNQCSTHLGLRGLPMAKYGHFGSKKAVFGHFWGPPLTFPGGLKGPNWPPRKWRTLSNPVHPMFNQFGVAGTAYGQIWPFLA